MLIKKKGYFVHPVIYNLAKNVQKSDPEKPITEFCCALPTLNLRSSFYINKIKNVALRVHDGRNLILSNPYDFIKNKYNFKIGQITYNRHLLEKRTIRFNRDVVIQDLEKKKRGFVLKSYRRKKYSYFKYNGPSS